VVGFSQRHSANVPWLNDPLRKRLQISGAHECLLPDHNRHQSARVQALDAARLSAWRYHLRALRLSVELRALHDFSLISGPKRAGSEMVALDRHIFDRTAVLQIVSSAMTMRSDALPTAAEWLVLMRQQYL
jgi:hypothetical protein